jgi:hypothetical protein
LRSVVRGSTRTVFVSPLIDKRTSTVPSSV